MLAPTKALIDTLDAYVNTGIGLATSIKPLWVYLRKHPEVLKP